jgi:hypothetical protein
MSIVSPDELLSRCVMLDNGDEKDVEFPEGYMFMPDPGKARGGKGNRYETSVILHRGQTDAQLDDAGKYIEAKNKKHPRYLGRCVCRVGDVEAVNSLLVEPQPSRISEHHANIIGWSNEMARQVLEAERIAVASVYVQRAS